MIIQCPIVQFPIERCSIVQYACPIVRCPIWTWPVVRVQSSGVQSLRVQKGVILKNNNLTINWIFVPYTLTLVELALPNYRIHFFQSNIVQSVRYLHIRRAKKSTKMLHLRIFFSVTHWAIKAILTYLESKQVDKHFRLKGIAINWIYVLYACRKANTAKIFESIFLSQTLSNQGNIDIFGEQKIGQM